MPMYICVIIVSLESELKQLLKASTKMNRAKIIQIEQLTNTIKKKEGKLLKIAYCYKKCLQLLKRRYCQYLQRNRER